MSTWATLSPTVLSRMVPACPGAISFLATLAFAGMALPASAGTYTPGEPIHALMEQWKAAAQRTLPERAWGERRWFAAAAHALQASGARVDLRRRWLGRGYLVVNVMRDA